MIDIQVTDNSDAILEAFREAVGRSLERMGQVAEGHAKDYAPVDTGHLKECIHHAVADDEQAVYIGTKNEEVDYSIYQELGTVKMSAQPFLKPSVANHAGEYTNIIKDELKNG